MLVYMPALPQARELLRAVLKSSVFVSIPNRTKETL